MSCARLSSSLSALATDHTLLAFVLVIYIGRRYGEMEEMPEGPKREQMEQRLHRLDETWPLTVVIFSSVSIVLCWFTLPPGG